MTQRRGTWLRHVILAWMAATACTVWQPSIAPSSAPQGSIPNEVRVRLRDGSSQVLRQTVVRGDSISGTVAGHGVYSFALADVTTLQQGRLSKTRTALTLFAVAAVVIVVAASASGSGGLSGSGY